MIIVEYLHLTVHLYTRIIYIRILWMDENPRENKKSRDERIYFLYGIKSEQYVKIISKSKQTN